MKKKGDNDAYGHQSPNLNRRWFGILAILPLGACFLLLGEISEISANFPFFVLLFSAAWLFWLAAFIALPKGVSKRELWIWLFVPALAFRIMLFPLPPGDDIHRYKWEGRLVLQGINPYAVPPNHSSLVQLRHSSWERINHKDMTAIYPPGVLLLFAGLSISGGSNLLFKGIFSLFDLGTLFLLLLILRARGVNERWGALYAFNPVILLSFAGHAHFDSVMLFFMTAAFLSYFKSRWISMFIFFSLAFQIKYIGILPVFFLLNRQNWKSCWALVPGIIFPYLIFLNAGVQAIFRSLFQFGFNMAHNGVLPGMLRKLLGDICIATIVSVLAFGLFLLWIYREENSDPFWKAAAAVGGFLLFIPTVHFWYITWFIPFLCFYPAWPWLVMCLTACLYFKAGQMELLMGYWHYPGWTALLQWLPVCGLLVFEWLKFHTRKKNRMPAMSSWHISLIIPVLDAEKELEKCLKHLEHLEPGPAEIVVSDGGSKDATRRLAQDSGAIVVKSPPGRGGQISAGVKAASGDICVVLHADTRLEFGILQKIVNAFKRDDGLVGGAVGQKFEKPGFLLRTIELLNDFRASLMGIAFGDQVQFFRRDAALKKSLVPEIPLMEDVELSFRLRNCGRTLYQWGQSEVSNYKWQIQGLGRFWLVLKLLATYFLRKLNGRTDTSDLYRKYYK